jgi:HSP20 family protein
MLMRFDPFRDIDALTQALAAPGPGRSTLMAMDAYREGDQLVVLLDLPGVDPQAIDMTVDQNVLTISAERRWEPGEGQEVIIAERRQGRFTRQLFLGDTLDADRIQAAYDRGVLTVKVPVAEEAKPRRVEVQVSDSDTRQIGANTSDEQPSGSAREREGEMATTAS